MLTQIYKIHGLCNNKFAIMSHPMGGESLSKNIENIKHQGYEVVISMLTHEEQKELDMLNEGEICKRNNMLFINFPIRDEVADSDEDTIKFINDLELLQKLKSKIIFHCRGGVGRSSMILSLLASRLGVAPNVSFDLISKSRGELAPENDIQKQWGNKLSNAK